MFDSAADLKKDTKYRIEAFISGRPSGCGSEGRSSIVHCSGVTFTFSSSDSRNSNGTGQAKGQFPAFLFSTR